MIKSFKTISLLIILLLLIPTLSLAAQHKVIRVVDGDTIVVDYKGKYAHMKGGLVNYGERIFFVSESRIEALSSFRKWNFKSKNYF